MAISDFFSASQLYFDPGILIFESTSFKLVPSSSWYGFHVISYGFHMILHCFIWFYMVLIWFNKVYLILYGFDIIIMILVIIIIIIINIIILEVGPFLSNFPRFFWILAFFFSRLWKFFRIIYVFPDYWCLAGSLEFGQIINAWLHYFLLAALLTFL